MWSSVCVETYSEEYYTSHSSFLIAYLVEVLRLLMGHSQMSAAHLVGMFLTGGIGPGSYYYPVMLEFVILFPILYFIMKRHPLRGIIICAALNLAFEIGKNMIGMSPEVYRLMIHLIINIIVCMGIGYAFYRIEWPVTKKIIANVTK